MFLAGFIALNISRSKTKYNIYPPNESLKRDAVKERRGPRDVFKLFKQPKAGSKF